MNTLKRFILIPLIGAFLCACGAAGGGGTNVSVSDIGNVEGTVTDATTSAPVSGVTVQIGDKTATTNASGVYSIMDLAVGSRPMTATKTGYQSNNGTVTVTKGMTVSHNIQMSANGTTTDTTPPTVFSTIPASNATSIAINGLLTVIFSEAMDCSTITTSSFTLKDSSNNSVAGNITTCNGALATFTPSANLGSNNTYTAMIAIAVKDAAGKAMVSGYSWSFTTGSQADTTSGNPSVAAKTGSLPSGSSQCPTGGVSIDTGIDQNGNGVLDSYEVTNTVYVCNGATGSTGQTGTSGLNALIKTTAESAGTNCANGGLRIDSGLDLNSNGTLATTEVTSTSYVCNGASGSTAPTDGNVCTTYTPVGTQTSFSCNGTASKQQVDYYNIGSCGSGTPIKTCAYESCSNLMYDSGTYAGYYSHTKQTGTGCALYEMETLYCQAGYVASNGICISLLSTLNTQQACTTAGKNWWNNSCHDGCPLGQVTTSRGCEVPITTCTQFQNVVDNACVNISFTSLTGNICGQYLSPVQITAGSHLVTCDSDFKEKVIIDAGANLLVDNYWGITFKDIYFKGTPTNHIVFAKSGGNPASGWKSLTIQNGKSQYHYANGYLSGNYLSYVDISGLQFQGGGITIKNAYLENLAWNQAVLDVALSNVYVTNSSFNVNSLRLSTDYSNYSPSIFTRNTVTTSNAPYFNHTVTAWSTFNGYAPSLYYGSALMFSIIPSGSNVTYCSDSDNYVYGNKVTSVGTACSQSDNSSLAVSDKAAAYILNSSSNAIYVDQNKDFEVYVLNKTNWLTTSNINWLATYDRDGVVYNYPTTWTGYLPTVLFTSKESYKLNIDSIDGSNLHIGKKSVTVNVW